MAAAFRASAVGSLNPTTSTTGTIPAGTLEDDIVYVAITNRDATTAPTVVDDEGAGAYAMIRNQPGGTNGAGSLWWKRATANTASKTVTTSGLTGSCAMVIYVVSGVPAAIDPWHGLFSQANASGAESTTVGLNAHPEGGSLGLLIVFNTGNDNAVTVQSFASGGLHTLGNAAEHLSTGGNDCGVNVSSAAAVSSPLRSYGAGFWTQLNGTTAVIMLDIPGALDNSTDAIPLIAQNCGHSSTSTTGANVGIPHNVAADDFLELWITNRDGTGDPTVVDDEGAGAWAKIANQAAGTNGSLSVWWKRAAADTAEKTITISGVTGSCSSILRCYRNVDTGATPYEQVSGEANASGDESHAQITPTVNGTRVSFGVGNTANDTNAVTTMACTDPGALAYQTQHVSTGGNDCSVDAASAMQATAAATGNFTWAQTNGPTASIAFALLPPAAPGAPVVTEFGLHAIECGVAGLIVGLSAIEHGRAS